MKTNRHSFAVPGLALGLLVPAIAIAIEPPADDTPPPASLRAKREVAAAAPVEPRRPAAAAPAEPRQPEAPAAFAGLVTAEVPEMLAAHLNLDAGKGVIIRAVMPDGPAAAAGIAVHDVITGIDNNPVDSPADLSREILARQPGDEVTLSLIHQGKESTLSITLIDRPAEAHAFGPRRRGNPMLDNLHLEGMPHDQAQRLRGLIEQNLNGFDGPNEMPMQEMMEEMKRRMGDMMKGAEPGLGIHDPENHPKFRMQSDATVRLMDEHGSLELRSKDGGKEVTLRDKNNEITWTGPWDTDQDKAAAPEGVRERIENLNLEDNFAGGLRFRFGPKPLPAPAED